MPQIRTKIFRHIFQDKFTSKKVLPQIHTNSFFLNLRVHNVNKPKQPKQDFQFPFKYLL